MIDLTIRRFDAMKTIFAEYNPQCNSIDVYTSAGYMLRIDCWEAEKKLKTTPRSDCALNALPIHTVSSSLITNSLLPHSNNLLHDIYYFYISQLLY